MEEQNAQLRDVLGDLPRGRHAGYIGQAPSAHFEPAANLLATESLRFDTDGNQAAKLFLGVLDGRVEQGPRLPDGRATRFVTGGYPIGVGDDRHHILMAGSRAGKGRSFLTPNLICLPNSTSFLCVDPKGDLARTTARWRADGLGQQVGILDPFGVCGPIGERFQVKFNPLGLLRPEHEETFVPNAKLIADSLVVTGDFKDRHWDETAKMILGVLILHAMTYERYAEARDLVTVWHLASELATVATGWSRK